ncbi:putative membrane protein required for colicin V production [Bacilli bacterium PM5-3]|nr:putative membrane protein required for colicin V production [Bacilli bacterium PM5-3]MDH6603260.1 putative membrane protein required for colicin V production [Bacilli bacterium PM5-9]
MIIDILIVILLIALIILGYIKGFMVGLINFIIGVIYLYFSNDLLNVCLKLINNAQLTSDIHNNNLMKYLIIAVLGIVIMLIVNIILRKVIKGSIISKFDRLGGVVIYAIIAYFILCVVSVIYSTLDVFIEFPKSMDDSFFLSKSFHDYNFLYRWWLNGK